VPAKNPRATGVVACASAGRFQETSAAHHLTAE
jgi:hypothetical protein